MDNYYFIQDSELPENFVQQYGPFSTSEEAIKAARDYLHSDECPNREVKIVKVCDVIFYE